jgi:hypothetical protein
MPPPIRFYLPEKIPDGISTPWDSYQLGVRGLLRRGVVAWTVQTFQRLRQTGFPCELTHSIPADGILVAHRKSIPRDFIPPPGVLFICLLADATFHPFAHLHVVQNRRALRRWFPSVYMPHWPQPGLIPRDPDRGDTWENAAYVGDAASFSGQMQGADWEEMLRGLKLRWHFVPPEKWHDFREMDVIVAVRSFDHHRHENKPPTKLFNAWHAGVPAVLGRESAYQQERRSTLDYREADSFAGVIAALRQLKADPAARQAMIANGLERAKESDPAVITARWREFFETVAAPAYTLWSRASPTRRALFRGNGWLKTTAQDWRERLGH